MREAIITPREAIHAAAGIGIIMHGRRHPRRVIQAVIVDYEGICNFKKQPRRKMVKTHMYIHKFSTKSIYIPVYVHA
jgi:hypothetical protein